MFWILKKQRDRAISANPGEPWGLLGSVWKNLQGETNITCLAQTDLRKTESEWTMFILTRRLSVRVIATSSRHQWWGKWWANKSKILLRWVVQESQKGCRYSHQKQKLIYGGLMIGILSTNSTKSKHWPLSEKILSDGRGSMRNPLTKWTSPSGDNGRYL